MIFWVYLVLYLGGAWLLYVVGSGVYQDLKEVIKEIKSRGVKVYLHHIIFERRTKRYVAYCYMICGMGYLIMCLCVAVTLEQIVENCGGRSVVNPIINTFSNYMIGLAAILSIALMGVFLFEGIMGSGADDREGNEKWCGRDLND